MATYRITCRVESAKGVQTFLVEAENEKAALAEYGKTGGEFEFEEVNVMGLGEPEVELAEEGAAPASCGSVRTALQRNPEDRALDRKMAAGPRLYEVLAAVFEWMEKHTLVKLGNDPDEAARLLALVQDAVEEAGGE